MSASYRVRDLVVTDHTVTVPLDWHAADDGRTIAVFAREVVQAGRDDAPLLVYLQGGPGGRSPRPSHGGWLKEVLRTHRLLLLDQRGTGRSTPVQRSSIAGMSGTEAAAYLRLFRAEQIVEDLEHIRRHVYGGARWQTLGQSYGGFLTLTYLSRHPEALSAAYVTGGLTSIRPEVDEIYRRTLPRVAAKTAEFYRRYPHDVDRMRRVVDLVENDDWQLPSGDVLSARRLQTIGIDFGRSTGYDSVHWLLDLAFAADGGFSDQFLAAVDRLTQYEGNPLYALLQEEIYADGAGATAWSAHRMRAELGGFEPDQTPVPFTGEMFFPWQYDEVASLRAFRDAAHALADAAEHPSLYDPDQLAQNPVPLAAAMYYDDMYVDFGLAEDTVHQMSNAYLWVTNEYEHDGLGADTRVVRALIDRVVTEGGPL